MGYRQGGKATCTRTADRTQVSVPNIFLTDQAVVEHCHPNCYAMRDLQQDLAAAAVVGDIVIHFHPAIHRPRVHHDAASG